MSKISKNPSIPVTVQLWKHPLKWLGNLAIIGGLVGVFVHYLRFGPKTVEDDRDEIPRKGEQP